MVENLIAHDTEPLPVLDPARTAFFFDLDGTLVDVADEPGAVIMPPVMLDVLGRLSRGSGGALAVISGRGIDDLDRLLAPLRLPLAGLHGAQLRQADGKVEQLLLDPQPIEQIVRQLEILVRDHPGLLIENKGVALAVHYRHAPECEQLVGDTLERLIQPYPDLFALQPGKMVLEIKPRAANKGMAIAHFMRQAPFLARKAVFAGDDRTDEAGFDTVNALGGLSIKIGEGPTSARHRIASPHALARWLRRSAGGPQAS